MSFTVNQQGDVLNVLVDNPQELLSRAFQTAYYKLYMAESGSNWDLDDVLDGDRTKAAWANLAKVASTSPMSIGLTNRSTGALHTLRVQVRA